MTNRLFDLPADPQTLTDRQQRALGHIRDAAHEGLTNEQLGRLVHQHDGCNYCASTGLELGRVLRRKGLARQRRRDGGLVWTVAGPGVRAGEFPDGF